MANNTGENDRKGILIISGLAALIGGLCCLTPVVLVLVGLASISAAAGLGNMLYGDYKWAFRLVALGFLALALWFYFRQKGICTLDQARRERNRIINTSLVILIFAVGAYIAWTYVTVHYLGIWAGLPWAQYDESWALLASAVVLGIAVVLHSVLFRRSRKAGKAEAREAAGVVSKPSA